MAVEVEKSETDETRPERSDLISPDDSQYPFIISDYNEGPKYFNKDDKRLWWKIVTKIVTKSTWRVISESDRHNTWNYVRARLLIRNGQKDEAREILSDLDQTTGSVNLKTNTKRF